MEPNLFTKIENKIYFKVTTAFWHILIGLGVLAIAVGIVFVLWNYIPTSKQEVKKQSFPQKEKYPPAVTVSYTELNDLLALLNEGKKQTKTETTASSQPAIGTKPQENIPAVITDIQGEKDFKASIWKLKTMIPPEKYKTLWDTKGSYTYPDGEAYWKKTHNEAYRHFNATQLGLEDKLKAIADNFPDRKKLLDGYIIALSPLIEGRRPEFLEFILRLQQKPIDRAIILAQTLAKVLPSLPEAKSREVLESLVRFSQKNQAEGVPFIKYTGTILEKFDSDIRDKIIFILEDNYLTHYNNNLQSQIDATDLFLLMVNKINADIQDKALQQYYKMYIGKNISRASGIAQIDQRYIADTMQINQNYIQGQMAAEIDYQIKKNNKSENRTWWYRNIGIGILVIILISNILVIFNMQRTLKKIDEKMESPNTNN